MSLLSLCVCGIQHTYILCWSYLALGNLVLLVSVHHRDRLNSDLLHFISLQRNKTTRYLLFCACCGKPPDHLTVLFWVIGVVGHAKLQHYLQARIEAWLLKLEAWSWHWNFLSSNSIPLYLSPELSIDVVSCESCDLPPLGNRAQVTCCHHQTNHTVPGGEQSLVISMQKETKAAFKNALSATASRPVWMVVQVQATGGQELRQLLVVVEVEGKVGGDDSLPNDLQHLLVLAGIQVGENIVPFQLWKTKRSIKKQKLHLWGVQLSYTPKVLITGSSKPQPADHCAFKTKIFVANC